jgi:hypothetical protein
MAAVLRKRACGSKAARHTPNMVIYRVVERASAKFVIEAFSDDHGSWRFVDEFPTREEANARMARLEQISRASQGKLA